MRLMHRNSEPSEVYEISPDKKVEQIGLLGCQWLLQAHKSEREAHEPYLQKNLTVRTQEGC